jgi:hypothetical protein
MSVIHTNNGLDNEELLNVPVAAPSMIKRSGFCSPLLSRRFSALLGYFTIKGTFCQERPPFQSKGGKNTALVTPSA